MLLYLQNDAIAHIISYLALEDMGYLDTAVTNRSQRSYFLAAAQCHCFDIDDLCKYYGAADAKKLPNNLFLAWLRSRDFNVSALSVIEKNKRGILYPALTGHAARLSRRALGAVRRLCLVGCRSARFRISDDLLKYLVDSCSNVNTLQLMGTNIIKRVLPLLAISSNINKIEDFHIEGLYDSETFRAVLRQCVSMSNLTLNFEVALDENLPAQNPLTRLVSVELHCTLLHNMNSILIFLSALAPNLKWLKLDDIAEVTSATWHIMAARCTSLESVQFNLPGEDWANTLLLFHNSCPKLRSVHLSIFVEALFLDRWITSLTRSGFCITSIMLLLESDLIGNTSVYINSVVTSVLQFCPDLAGLVLRNRGLYEIDELHLANPSSLEFLFILAGHRSNSAVISALTPNLDDLVVMDIFLFLLEDFFSILKNCRQLKTIKIESRGWVYTGLEILEPNNTSVNVVHLGVCSVRVVMAALNACPNITDLKFTFEGTGTDSSILANILLSGRNLINLICAGLNSFSLSSLSAILICCPALKEAVLTVTLIDSFELESLKNHAKVTRIHTSQGVLHIKISQ